MLSNITDYLAAAPSPRIRRKNSGSAIEALVLASQNGVRLTKVPTASKRIFRGGHQLVIQIPGPCDFYGCFTANGRAIVIDAKSTDCITRIRLDESHFAEHQRQQLLIYGESNAISGLLCECTTTRAMYWCGWRSLGTRVPSIAWVNMLAIGSSAVAINWQKILDAERIS